MAVPHTPTNSQRLAIESPDNALLVFAGPGSGKTFCLIERIRFLVEKRGFDPSRICAFTFTNKAAEEIASRLQDLPGEIAEKVTRSTIHKFCAELLRKNGSAVGVTSGFGIADDEYQKRILRRLGVREEWRRGTLIRFSVHKMRGDPFTDFPDDKRNSEKYTAALRQNNMLDFDDLVIKGLELLKTDAGYELCALWDVILVDEFQDLDAVKYGFIRELSRRCNHVFAVGDDEQSIYSWAGANPAVFADFQNHFSLTSRILLEENHRCPGEVYEAARALIGKNSTLFESRPAPGASPRSGYPVVARLFAEDAAELQWLIEDLQSDRDSSGLDWSDYALLYRRNEMGQSIEAALVNAGIPCRLAQSRSLAEDPTIAYLIAAMRIIQSPQDEFFRDAFFSLVLPPALFNNVWANARRGGVDLLAQLRQVASRLPREHPDAKRIWRSLSVHRNLDVLPQQYGTLKGLIQELLSQRIKRDPTMFEERHNEISDPEGIPEVVQLSRDLRRAMEMGSVVWIDSAGGGEIPVSEMLRSIGCAQVQAGGVAPDGALRILAENCTAVGLPLSILKAAQIIAMDGFVFTERNFTAIDIEATHTNTELAQTVDIAAVRVRDGRIVDKIDSLVRPSIHIPGESTRIHGLVDADVQSAPTFSEVWPEVHKFCGDDLVVAHNGHTYDFPVLARQAAESDLDFKLFLFDTLPLARDLFATSGSLPNLAEQFGVTPGTHRALEDTICLASVYLKLQDEKVARARKTACQDLLQHLGIALALSDQDTLSPEARIFADICRVYVFGRYSHALEHYEEARAGNESIPSVEELIELVGGSQMMNRIRAEKTPMDRYPAAMRRLEMLLQEIPNGTLAEQMRILLDRIALSKQEGPESMSDRVNLLTVHATKGLEFSRVYIVGTETSEFPGTGRGGREQTIEEIEEARRLLYVGMTRTKHRLVMTCVERRGAKQGQGYRFLDEMGIAPQTGN